MAHVQPYLTVTHAQITSWVQSTGVLNIANPDGWASETGVIIDCAAEANAVTVVGNSVMGCVITYDSAYYVGEVGNIRYTTNDITTKFTESSTANISCTNGTITGKSITGEGRYLDISVTPNASAQSPNQCLVSGVNTVSSDCTITVYYSNCTNPDNESPFQNGVTVNVTAGTTYDIPLQPLWGYCLLGTEEYTVHEGITYSSHLNISDPYPSEVYDVGQTLTVTATPTANAGNETIHISCTGRTFTITFSANGATSGSAPSPVTAIYANSSSTINVPSVPSLTKYGYNVDTNNWNKNNSGTGANVSAGTASAINSTLFPGTASDVYYSILVYAKWIPRTFNIVSGSLQNCSKSGDNTIDYNGTATVTITPNAGHTLPASPTNE